MRRGLTPRGRGRYNRRVTIHRARALLWAIPALAVLSFAGQRHALWGTDEPREAEIAREMYASGEWVVPRLNGEPFLEKPPLAHLGAVLVFHAAGGPTEEWCRLPSAAWGLAGLLATAWLGAMLAGPGAGLLSAFILATSVEWIHITRYLLVDVPLASCVIISLACFWAGHTRRGPARALGYIGAACAAGGAFMAKGTVGIAIPLSAVGAYLIPRRRWREFALACCAFAAGGAAATLPWMAMLAARGGSPAIKVFLWDNQVLRFFSPRADHSGPPWFYIVRIFELFLPWAFLLPPALLALARPGAETETERGRRHFLLAAIIAPFALLSAASGKRHLYLLPLLPAFAIATARWAGGEWPGGRRRWEIIWMRVCAAALAMAAVAAWCAALVAAFRARSGSAAAAASLAAAAAAVWVLSRVRPRGGGAGDGWRMAAYAALAWSAALSPAVWGTIDAAKGYAPLTEMLDSNILPGDVLHAYIPDERELGVVGFHRRVSIPVIGSVEALDELLRGPGGNAVLMREKAYDELAGRGELPASAAVAARCVLPHRNQVLLRASRPAR